jgi:hypothetical protein
MPTFTFTSINVPAAAGTYEYISADGVDAAGEVVGNYGNVDGEGDSDFSGFTAESSVGITFNPPDSSNTDVVGITAGGEIFGNYTDGLNLKQYGFVDDNGVFQQINVFLANSTNVLGVSATGEIFGSYADETNVVHGFIDNNGSFTTLDVPGATTTSISGINAAGEIIGSYTDAAFQVHGFIDINGTFTTVDPSGSILTNLIGVTTAGVVVGEYENSSGVNNGFVDDNGVITTIPFSGAHNVNVSAVNAAGEIVGNYIGSDGEVHGFVDDAGVITKVDIPGSIDTNVLGVDASGNITGYYDDSSGHQHAFVGIAAPCYGRGTLILTDRGETAVEMLKIGDNVMTMSGPARAIKWIGRRSYSGRFALGQTHILPICITAGALDENVPRRDLWISPHHAMYLEGVLIEARDLVNGVSIAQAERVEKIEYFHIELDTHDIIIAEGALSESFIDDDSRGMFHNAHEYRTLYPNPGGETRYCAPRLDSGYAVEAAHRRIAARAGLLVATEDRHLALRGHVDAAGPRRIAGWAQNTEHPEAPVCLDIYAGDRLLGQILANRYREDLERAGLGSGRHGFEFTPPAALAFAPEAIEVRRSLDGAPLGFSVHAGRIAEQSAARAMRR